MIQDFATLAFWIALCAALGSAVGFLCRGRTALELVLSFSLAIMAFVCFARADFTKVNWSSFGEAYATIMEALGPFFYFFFVPAAVAALLIGRSIRKRSIGQ